MRKLGGFVTITALACVLAAMLAVPSQARMRHHEWRAAAHEHAGVPRYAGSRAYDGLWSVAIRTQAGPCDPSYRYPARIVGGQIRQADNDFSYQISGVVVSSGAIAVTVSKGLGTATGYGRLHGASGYGRWSTAGDQCYGTWSAMRRTAN